MRALLALPRRRRRPRRPPRPVRTLRQQPLQRRRSAHACLTRPAVIECEAIGPNRRCGIAMSPPSARGGPLTTTPPLVGCAKRTIYLRAGAHGAPYNPGQSNNETPDYPPVPARLTFYA